MSPKAPKNRPFMPIQVSMLWLVTDILAYIKYSVDTVSNGTDAHDYALGGNCDGIILDIVMPGCPSKKLLDRLYREDVSRTSVGGYGIGL